MMLKEAIPGQMFKFANPHFRYLRIDGVNHEPLLVTVPGYSAQACNFNRLEEVTPMTEEEVAEWMEYVKTPEYTERVEESWKRMEAMIP